MVSCVSLCHHVNLSSQVIQYQEQSNLASPLLVKSKWTNGLGRTHNLWLYLLGLSHQMAFPRKSTKSPSLTGLTFWKTLSQTICHTPRSWRFAHSGWHGTATYFYQSVVRYAYRFSIRRRSRLTVIIMGLSKRRRGWNVAAQRSFQLDQLSGSHIIPRDSMQTMTQKTLMSVMLYGVVSWSGFQAGRNKYGSPHWGR